MNIVVSGLTGSGKTSLARGLASNLDMTVISGSDLRRRALGLATDRGDRLTWLTDPIARAADGRRMLNGAESIALNRSLAELHDSSDGLIFDVWFAAWLVQKDSLRIWLEAPFEVRAERAIADIAGVESDNSALFNRLDLARALQEKDETSRAFALKHYGFDISCDRAPFNVILRSDAVPQHLLCEIGTAIATARLGVGTTELSGPGRAALPSVLARYPLDLADELS